MRSTTKVIQFVLMMILVGAVGLSWAQHALMTVPQPPTPDSAGQSTEKAIVDFQADVMRPVKVGDSSALNLVGNVIFFHNNTIISCDSAVRYSDRYMECFGNVIVNKFTTYIYGERADYNGMTNIANIYSPLIKMIDKDVTMYCYNLNFNTSTNIGSYTGGATITQRGNTMEAQQGEFNSNLREVTFMRNVEMETQSNKIVTNSMMYDMNTEVTTFYTQSHFWNDKDEFLLTDYGFYDKILDKYTFTKNSYILSKDQEIWADSIVYLSGVQQSTLRNNIQIFDREQNSYLFGDYGTYWGQEERAFVTNMPSMITIEVKPEKSDSLYMRGDSIFVFSVHPGDIVKDTTAKDSLTLNENIGKQVAESTNAVKRVRKNESDSLSANDKKNTEIAKPLTEKELKKQAKEEAKVAKAKIKAEKKALKAEARRIKKAQREEVAKIKRDVRNAAREAKRKAKHPTVLDVLPKDYPLIDTLLMDSLRIDSLAKDSLAKKMALDSAENAKGDKTERIIRSYRNVKMFRSDFQSVADSLVAFSVDSTLHMFGNPALWSEKSQITSDTMVVYTKDGAIDRAVFDVEPMMVEFVQDSLYNQVAGKYMEAFFKDNGITSMDVDGNAQTYYYLQESDSVSTEIVGFMVADCSKIRFIFVDGEMDRIIYKGDPVYTIYPMDKIPDTQTQILKGFKWRVNERPQNYKEICSRVIKPSVRAEREKFPKPTFPITKSINTFRKSLLKSGSWKDRTTTLKYTPAQ